MAPGVAGVADFDSASLGLGGAQGSLDLLALMALSGYVDNVNSL